LSVGYGTWQASVETAQFVAGLVRYPADNPVAIYHAKYWSIVHQVLAVALAAGVSERTLSLLLSGVIGLLSFAAVALCTFALSRNALVAVAMPPLVFWSGAANYGPAISISLLGRWQTMNVLGLAFVMLVIAAFALGANRAGAFGLGLVPAVHATFGALCWIVVVAALVPLLRARRVDARAMARWFALGLAVTAASVGWELVILRGVAPIASDAAALYVRTFVALWDAHRQPVPLGARGLVHVAAAMVIAWLWLRVYREDLREPAPVLLRVVLASGVLSVIAVALSWLPPDRVPALILVSMPARVLNFAILAFPLLVIGLLAAQRMRPLSQIVLLGVVFGTVMRPELASKPLLLGAAGLIVARTLEDRAPALMRRLASLLVPARVAVAVVLVATTALVAARGYVRWRDGIEPLRDRTNDAVFAAAAGSPGLLLTGGDAALIQLRTRRPVLLDGSGLDGLMYAAENGPIVVRILRDVYGIDFFHPPKEALGMGAVPRLWTRDVWERRSLAEWQAIRRAYGVTEVMTFADWTLALPDLARGAEFRLYRIPLE
jgi:hypothetical protein